MREKIAHDCGVADADNRVDALIAYSQHYGLDVIHWRVRYPELAQDRGFSPATTQICHPAPTDWRGLQADAVGASWKWLVSVKAKDAERSTYQPP